MSTNVDNNPPSQAPAPAAAAAGGTATAGHSGRGIGSKIKGVWKVAHGIGENIRGATLGAADSAAGAQKERNAEITAKGKAEITEGLARLNLTGHGPDSTGTTTGANTAGSRNGGVDSAAGAGAGTKAGTGSTDTPATGHGHGRDAAGAATAAGLVEGADKHKQSPPQEPQIQGQGESQQETQSSGGHHLTHSQRDATAGVGAAGLGAGTFHEYREHQDKEKSGTDIGAARGDKADDEGGQRADNEGTNAGAAQPGKQSDHTRPSSQQTSPSNNQSGDHHYGRDITSRAGVPGLGAGGTRADSKVDDVGAAQPGGQSNQARQGGQQNLPTDNQSDDHHNHHYGRDIASGVGAAGVGAGVMHKYDEHQQQGQQHEEPKEKPDVSAMQRSGDSKEQDITGVEQEGEGETRSDRNGQSVDEHRRQEQDQRRTEREQLEGTRAESGDEVGAAQPGGRNDQIRQSGQQTSPSDNRSDDHHYGRDIASGVGAAGLGAGVMHKYDEQEERKEEPGVSAGKTLAGGESKGQETVDVKQQGGERRSSQEDEAQGQLGSGEARSGRNGQSDDEPTRQEQDDRQTESEVQKQTSSRAPGERASTDEPEGLIGAGANAPQRPGSSVF